MIKDLLSEYNVPYSPLGSGTNRIGILIDGYAFKIALDEDGMIDNRREFLYTTELQPYVVKVYEISPLGLIAVTEYVTIFTYDDFRMYADDMRDILKEISRYFLIGDVGITGKNYVNWGYRDDGTVCILDFAYIYSVEYKLFTCSCNDDALLDYDDDFVKLICPYCGRKYTFGSIRKKVTKSQQEAEIGDMDTQGYILTQPLAELPVNPAYEPKKHIKDKKKKKLSETKKLIREYKKSQEEDGDDPYSDWGQL